MTDCGDPTCPCQDGDLCHYADEVVDGKIVTKAMERWRKGTG